MLKFRDMLLENKSGDQANAKKLLDRLDAKYNKKSKDIRQDILKNIVNSPYGHTSNNYIDIIWTEFNKRYPS